MAGSGPPGSGALTTRLEPAVADRVLALIGRAAETDGTDPVSEQGVHAVRSDGDVRHLAWIAGGEVVGYAQVQPGHDPHPAMVEAVVDPAHRGRGIGTDVVREALGAAGPGARVWAHGDVPAARAVAQRLGLAGLRELLQLRRTADRGPLPDLVVPDDISLGTYRGPEDDAEILAVNAVAFSWHPEQGSWTERDIAERRGEPWFDPAGLFLARAGEAPHELLGFHWTKVHPPQGSEPAMGEVYVVGVSPSAQGRGLGRVLTLAGLHHLHERGLDTVLLYVEGDNTAALHTYERLGFTRFHSDIAYGAPANR